MIDPQELLRAFRDGFSPLPGRCLIEMDTVPTFTGILHLPESAAELRLMSQVRGNTISGDTSWTGKVLAVTPRRHARTGQFLEEDFSTGDRVLIMLLNEDMNQKTIVTRNERVYAVLTDDNHKRNSNPNAPTS